MKPALRILYVGPLRAGETCAQRLGALRELGCEVWPVDTCPPGIQARQATLTYRIYRKLIGPADLADANRAMLELARRESIDVVWIDKGLTIEAATFREIKALQPGCRLVGYSPDDMNGSHNQSRQFLEHLPLYDVFFTTKSFGVGELAAMGCRRVEFVGNAFDPATHRPLPVTAKHRQALGGPVGFIGHWEPRRPAALAQLTRHDVPVRVWGKRWERCRHRDPNLRLEHSPLWGDDYARAICAFDINLGFLSKRNRDLSTQRSVEIPACGGFLLAERTPEHQQLFEENDEAVFFDSGEELRDKTRFYLAHPTVRGRIAAAGRARCLKSRYRNQDRLAWMLQRLAP